MRNIKGRKLAVLATAVLTAGGLPALLSSSGTGLFSSAASATTPPPPDRVVYAQTTGSGGTYMAFYSGASTTPSATESFTGAGGCSTPTSSGPILMNLNAFLYADGTYSGTPAAAIMTQDKQKTGVCAIGQSWSIDNVPPNTAPQTGAEALDFTLLQQGTKKMSSLVSGRVFQAASLDLQRSDKLSGNVVIELVESTASAGVPTYTQCFAIPSTDTITGGGGTFVANTNQTSNYDLTDFPVCANSSLPSAGFDTLEIRVLSGGGSVSVVGPTSTFTFANQICAGQSFTTYSNSDPTFGQVAFTVTDNATSGCKSYTQFTAAQVAPTSTDPTNPGYQPTKTAEFDSSGTGNVDFTFGIDWGNFVKCSPDGSTPPECPPTYVTYVDSNNNTVTAAQTYCSQATTAVPLCTTSRNYSYKTTPAGYTDIQETWDGLIDNTFRI